MTVEIVSPVQDSVAEVADSLIPVNILTGIGEVSLTLGHRFLTDAYSDIVITLDSGIAGQGQRFTMRKPDDVIIFPYR